MTTVSCGLCGRHLGDWPTQSCTCLTRIPVTDRDMLDWLITHLGITGTALDTTRWTLRATRSTSDLPGDPPRDPRRAIRAAMQET